MDGIVPILFLLILIGLTVSGLISTSLIAVIIQYKRKSIKISKKLIGLAAFNIFVVGIATFLTVFGYNSIIGHSSFIYMAPILLVISLLVFIAI